MPKGKALTHGHFIEGVKSPTYISWQCMKRRCKEKSDDSYKNYGAKGVRVCERWDKFENFLEDMGERPGLDYVLSRNGDNGDYEPGNVAWKTCEENIAEQDKKGERNGSAKLKEHQIPVIRRMHEEGMSYVDIAKNFKVTSRSIGHIIRGKTWKHVP